MQKLREILFKAKHIHLLPQNEHLDGTWVEGYLCDENYIYSPKLKQEFLIDPETVCQYTGLTDNTKWEQLSEREKKKFLSKWNYKKERRNIKEDWNGRKIFEGDIVRDIFNGSVIGIVKYGEYRNTFNDDEHGGHVGFYVEWKEKRDLLRKDLVYWVKNSEFIGNIFDNTDLIGGQA